MPSARVMAADHRLREESSHRKEQSEQSRVEAPETPTDVAHRSKLTAEGLAMATMEKQLQSEGSLSSFAYLLSPGKTKSEDREDVMSIASQSLAAAAAATPPSRGRKKRRGPRQCGICAEMSDVPDPVGLCNQTDRMMELKCEPCDQDSNQDMRWAYPPVDGQPQGGFCWYCAQAVALHPYFAGKSCSAVKAECEQSAAVRTKAKEIKATVVHVARENAGSVTRALLSQRDVTRIKNGST